MIFVKTCILEVEANHESVGLNTLLRGYQLDMPPGRGSLIFAEIHLRRRNYNLSVVCLATC